MTNVSRIVALGGSIYRIIHVSEGPGSSRFRGVCGPGGSAQKNQRPETGGLETRDRILEMTNVSRIVSLAGWVRLKKSNTGDGRTGDRRLEVTNVSRIVALGSSIYRILRVSEGPGSSTFRDAVGPGGSL